mgnify:CR=1 FL=1
MRIDNEHYRTLWLAEDGWRVQIIDQTLLPHRFRVVTLETLEEAAHAIQSMQVRGAPLIGVTAAYGLALALRRGSSDRELQQARELLLNTRPTAVNLRWALDKMVSHLQPLPPAGRMAAAYQLASQLAEEDVALNRSIGQHGLALIKQRWADSTTSRLNILTHCNAGWLATVDYGTALAPVYAAHDAGIPIHVWVDETRPRNQGAALTAWELQQHGVPHTVIADNAGGYLMQDGQVDMVIVGTDRTAANGDVCNKIGTYLKALAAWDNRVPFYVALPGPTIDWRLSSGTDIPIEERDGREITHLTGKSPSGELVTVQVTPDQSPAGNPGFDITPARLVTGLITERGLCPATPEGLLALYPEDNRHG